jgi:integrase
MVSPKKGVSTILKAAKIEKLTIHDLRRTLGSWQAITGASLPIIGKSLGHKSIAATQIYARLSADPVRESVQRATGAIFEAAAAKEKSNEQ